MFWQARYASPPRMGSWAQQEVPSPIPLSWPGHTTGWRGLSLVGRDSAPPPTIAVREGGRGS